MPKKTLKKSKISKTSKTSKISGGGNHMDDRCAPSKGKYDGVTCLSVDGLVALANAYNNKHSDKIKLSNKLHTLNPTKYKGYLVEQFESRLSNICDDQKCWVEQPFAEEMGKAMQWEMKRNTWRPDGPKGRYTWLNTFNINLVMEQYESSHKGFKFLGAVPVDFEEINYPVEKEDFGFSEMDLNKMCDAGYKKLGVVFNLDEHDQGGSHWVAGYIDIDGGKVYYFDSYGEEPDRRIRSFLRKCYKGCKQMTGGKIDVRRTTIDDILVNDIRHQYKNSECGVYSINFIVRLLEGDTFDNIIKSKVDDETMNKNRKVYFNRVNF